MTTHRVVSSLLLLGAALSPLTAAPVHADPVPAVPELVQSHGGRWSLQLEPYLWFAAVDAETPAGRLDASFSDILDGLDMALMFGLVAEKEDSSWGFLLDAVYLDLEQGPLELQTTALTTLISFRPEESAPYSLLLGARYWNSSIQAGSLGGSANWLDPLVGARASFPLTDKLEALLYADLGGFGVGTASDFTWQGLASLDYALADGVRLVLGYRYLDVDQEKATTLDASFNGPVLGLSIRL